MRGNFQTFYASPLIILVYATHIVALFFLIKDLYFGRHGDLCNPSNAMWYHVNEKPRRAPKRTLQDKSHIGKSGHSN